MLAATVGGSWLWQIWIDRKESKRQKEKALKDCLEKIRHCMDEIDYNASSGIGFGNSPFKTAAQERLLYTDDVYLLSQEIIDALKKSILDVGTTKAGFPFIPLNRAKGSGISLKTLLEKQREALLFNKNGL